jgi:hypothetical protein
MVNTSGLSAWLYVRHRRIKSYKIANAVEIIVRYHSKNSRDYFFVCDSFKVMSAL